MTTPDSPKGPEAPLRQRVFDALWNTFEAEGGRFAPGTAERLTDVALAQIVPELERLTAELQAQNRLYRMVGTERDEKQFEIERLRRWVDRFRERAAEHAAEVSRLREQLAAQRPAQHKVRVTKLLGSGQSVAVCPGCKEGMTGPDQQAQDWKDQHEADTLRPTLTNESSISSRDEGRPSGSERLAPRPVETFDCKQDCEAVAPECFCVGTEPHRLCCHEDAAQAAWSEATPKWVCMGESHDADLLEPCADCVPSPSLRKEGEDSE